MYESKELLSHHALGDDLVFNGLLPAMAWFRRENHRAGSGMVA